MEFDHSLNFPKIGMISFDTWNLTPDTWHMTQDTLHIAHDTWHMTYDTWHMTCDTLWGVNIPSKFQLLSSYIFQSLAIHWILSLDWLIQLDLFTKQDWSHHHVFLSVYQSCLLLPEPRRRIAEGFHCHEDHHTSPLDPLIMCTSRKSDVTHLVFLVFQHFLYIQQVQVL